MISRNIFADILWAILLVMFQIIVLNRIIILDKYTPVLYPIFILFYPFFRNRYVFLTLSFILGLAVDINLGTWGINALACTTIAFFRTIIFRTSTDTTTDFFSFQSLQWSQFIIFIIFSIFIHQLIVQYLEFFKLSRFFEIFLNVLATTGISFIFIILFAIAFKIKEKV